MYTRSIPCMQRLGMCGAYAQVLKPTRVFKTWRDSCRQGDKVFCGKTRGKEDTHKVLPCMHRLGMCGAYAQVLKPTRVFKTWRDSCRQGDKVSCVKTRGKEDTHQVLPCMQRLGMCGAYAQVLEAWESVLDLVEIQLVGKVNKVSCEKDKVRGGCTPSLTLYAKTWDVWSICTSVGA